MSSSRPALRPHVPTRLAALAVAGALAAATLAACSGSDPDERQRGGRGIDARAYYEDYESSVTMDSGRAVSGTAPAGGAEVGRGEPGVPDIPDPDEDNRFVDAGSSGFVDPAVDPLSTFALDVDTGSFGVARTLLDQGYDVPPASVRTEEWVNAMSYDDPVPTSTDLGVTSESGMAPSLQDGTEVVRIGVSARDVDPAERPRVNLTLVVDRSGSMDIRERLGLVQSSLAVLADNLGDDDTVSVVSFEDQAKPILEPTPVSETDAIIEAIDDLEPGGSTNLEAGLRLGYEQARDAYDEDAVNLVVLASDGVANVGDTGPGSISETIAEEGAAGIHLVTVGYGMGNYNDHLMEQLADLGDGFYSYVDTFDEAERLFGTELTTTLTPVAGEARTQVEFDPELVTSYRLVGYDNRAIADEDFDDMAVDAGELGAGHHATALYEVSLADGVEPGEVIGDATVRWTSLDDGVTEEASSDLLAADPGADPSVALETAATVADAAQLMKGSPAYADRGLTLEALRPRCEELVAADVDGAEALCIMLRQA